MTQEGEVLSTVVLADAAVVFAQSDVEYPGEAVLNAPVGASDVEEVLWRRLQRGDAGFLGG